MMGSDVSGHLGNSPFLPDWVRQECLTLVFGLSSCGDSEEEGGIECIG